MILCKKYFIINEPHCYVRENHSKKKTPKKTGVTKGNIVKTKTLSCARVFFDIAQMIAGVIYMQSF